MNLIEIKSEIISLENHINQGYSDEVLEKGHYTQMRPLLENSWAIALDRKNPNKKDLETLCKLFLEEGKNRMPKHQRQMELLKARKAGNEKNCDWIERLHDLLEVAVVVTMTTDELGIHIFGESVDSTMNKLALGVLAKMIQN